MDGGILKRLSSSSDGTIESSPTPKAPVGIDGRAKLEHQRPARELHQRNVEKTAELKIAVERQKRLHKNEELKRIRESGRLIAMLARRTAIADLEKKNKEEAVKKHFLEDEEKLRVEIDKKARQEKERRSSLENIRLSQIEIGKMKIEEITKKIKQDRERIMKIELERILSDKQVAASRANETKRKESKKWIP